ncbi:CotS family spore coat protein [Clostridium sp.]|uniref:CotS family spore coat protein n=1 Tax=Clostridium sp. TaxID=1506 RepID=UPI002A919027|nr:CotS family spore coat protein [Clostridium sp.]MDY6013253.1 CotS family spore coat protein [Clostridium sp.]
MNEKVIKDLIEKNYDLEVKSSTKIKNTYKISADEEYCFKVVKYNFPHFYFILSAIVHLKNRGFSNVLDIIKDKKGNLYIELPDGSYAYLTKWIEARQADYNDINELKIVSENLSKLHLYSRDFTITPLMKPRIYWLSWINTFKTRRDEILDFAHRISQKAKKNEFDNIFLKNLNEEIKRANRSIDGLINSDYVSIMEDHLMKREFCHHDFANHNILIGKNNKINIIDFDYCILDSHLHDLCSLLIRSMKYNRWDIKKANIIFEGYSKNIEISKKEKQVIKFFMLFPQDFWQRGLQVYWEQQPWGEEFFVQKINKYLDDRKAKEEFLEDFFN